MSAPRRETTTISAAPSSLAAAWAVRLVPPLPRITTFFPAMSTPARRAMAIRPVISVL